jgi:ABC-2 type transport system ATP-binding protein
MTGVQFVESYLRVHGRPAREARELAWRALERVQLTEAATRRVAGYSKGMRQRVKLAQALCHDPRVLILDEPLNGLDPLVRAEVIALLRSLAAEERQVIVSSHILHEVDLISDRVVILSQGYVVAEGPIQSVRSELVAHPIQVLIRCDRPSLLASRVFEQDHVVEARLLDDRSGVLVHTRDADGFYLLLNRIVRETGLQVESVAPADEDVQAVYRYLVGVEGGPA